ELITLQRTAVMREADPAVELRITRHAFFDARHANEHQAERRAITDVTKMFEGGRRETCGVVNNDQLDPKVLSDAAFPITVDSAMLLDTDLHARRHPMKVFTEFLQGSADGWGMKNRPGTRQCGIHLVIGGLARPPCLQQRFCQIPVCM